MPTLSGLHFQERPSSYDNSYHSKNFDLEDFNNDSALPCYPVSPNGLQFWDHLLSITVLAQRALSWEISTATIQSLPRSTVSCLPFQDHLPSITLLTQRALTLESSAVTIQILSPSVITKWPAISRQVSKYMLMLEDYDLLVIMTWNFHSKYSPLTEMLICHSDNDFLYQILGWFQLENKKIDSWLTFPYLYLGVLFIILGSKPPYLCREVSHESLYQICRATSPQLKWQFSSCIFKNFNPSSHIVYVNGIPVTTLLGKHLGTGE